MVSKTARTWPTLWTWKLFTTWAGIDVDYWSLSPGERWSTVATAIPAVIRSRHLRPAKFWWLSRTSAWIVARRLQRRTHNWYRIADRTAAEHVRLRFDIWPIEVGDHVQFERGRLKAMAYSTATFSEIIFVLPNGEIEADPNSPEMVRAWARFAATRHQLFE